MCQTEVNGHTVVSMRGTNRPKQNEALTPTGKGEIVRKSPESQKRPKARTKYGGGSPTMTGVPPKSTSPMCIPARSSSRTPPGSNGGSPFAGFKFGDAAPSPKSLPKPPPHWFENRVQTHQEDIMAAQLKMLLKVQA